MKNRKPVATLLALALPAAAILVACSDNAPTEPAVYSRPTGRAEIIVPCTVSVQVKSVQCAVPPASPGRGSVLVGNQNVSIKLTSSNVGYDSGTQVFSFDLTVQNLMNEAMGTPDGVTPGAEGINVFFAHGPTVTGGAGIVTVKNADGTGFFTGAAAPYFRYSEILAHNQVSAAHTWQLNVPSSVTTFTFDLLIDAEVQYLLVINEVMANPPGVPTVEGPLEYVEIYNAGSRPVDMQGLEIADSSASGRRPYHEIASSLVIQPGGYVVLGGSTNTTDNGGAAVDYSWGSSVSLANSLDAFKIARVYGIDTLTIDRTQYSNAAVSAVEGVSRELKNPALDNSNMDGSNWGSASVTSVYGPGGRGTPKAQNSTFTPAVEAPDKRLPIPPRK